MRHADLGDDLARLNGSLVRSEVELARRNRALSILGTQHDGGAQRRHNRRQILGWVGLAQRSTDRSTVAHDRVGNHPLGFAEDRVVLVGNGRFEQLAVPRHRSDPDLVTLDAHIGHVEIVDVDQVLRSSEPKLHHRQEAVASGDEPGFGPESIQQCNGVVDARRSFVLERRWYLHGIPRSSRFPQEGGSWAPFTPPSTVA